MKHWTNAPQRQPSSGTGKRPWSFSQLKGQELCPLKWAAENHYRTIKDKDTGSTSHGKETHAAFEMRAKHGTALPLGLRPHEENVARLLTLGEHVETEVKIGVDEAYNAVDFFAPDVWCRAVIDMIVYGDEHALIVDWKTGQVRPDFDQLDIMAAMVKSLLPGLTKIVGAFYWTKTKSATTKVYHEEDVPEIWEGFLPRVAEFHRRIAEQDFPPRPNFLCRRHCQVTGCRHHGG